MTVNSPAPTTIVIEMDSAFAPHQMELCALAWSPGDIGTNVSGIVDTWDDTTVDVDTMVQEFVDLLKPFFLPTTTFNLYTVYTWGDGSQPPLPVRSQPLGQVGTSVSTTWAKAVSKTLTLRTLIGGIAKIVMLDVPSGNVFGTVNAFGADAATSDLVDAFTAVTNGWSGRDNSRPNVLIKQVTNLNGALQKQYHMV